MDGTCLDCRWDLFDLCALSGKKNEGKKGCKKWEAQEGLRFGRIRPKALGEYIETLKATGRW